MSAFWDLYHYQENALFHTCVEPLVVRSLDGNSGLLLALGFTAGLHRDPWTSVCLSASTPQGCLLVAVWTNGFARSITPQSALSPGTPLLVWLVLAVSQQHRYLYTSGCQLSNTGFFFELTDLATHMPRDPLVMCFSTSFSLVPTLLSAMSFSHHQPDPLVTPTTTPPCPMSCSPWVSFKPPYTVLLEKVTLISPEIGFCCEILTFKWVQNFFLCCCLSDCASCDWSSNWQVLASAAFK